LRVGAHLCRAHLRGEPARPAHPAGAAEAGGEADPPPDSGPVRRQPEPGHEAAGPVQNRVLRQAEGVPDLLGLVRFPGKGVRKPELPFRLFLRFRALPPRSPGLFWKSYEIWGMLFVPFGENPPPPGCGTVLAFYPGKTSRTGGFLPCSFGK